MLLGTLLPTLLFLLINLLTFPPPPGLGHSCSVRGVTPQHPLHLGPYLGLLLGNCPALRSSKEQHRAKCYRRICGHCFRRKGLLARERSGMGPYSEEDNPVRILSQAPSTEILNRGCVCVRSETGRGVCVRTAGAAINIMNFPSAVSVAWQQFLGQDRKTEGVSAQRASPRVSDWLGLWAGPGAGI